jgi:drug/metabolite transporter superfamily protein YnfA
MMPEFVQAVLTSLRNAIGASVATIIAGLSSVWGWLPNDIGWYASFLGVISTIILLWIQLRKDRREQGRYDADMDLRRRRRSD